MDDKLNDWVELGEISKRLYKELIYLGTNSKYLKLLNNQKTMYKLIKASEFVSKFKSEAESIMFRKINFDQNDNSGL